VLSISQPYEVSTMAENPKQLAPDATSATSGHALNYAAAVKEGPPELVSVLSVATKLLFVTSEMGDFIKAGGLGEVSSALPRQLRALCDVRVLIPASVRCATPGRTWISSRKCRVRRACRPGRSGASTPLTA
jgi:hypothetical protein